MEHRRLGKSDLEISVVTYGAWAIGGWMWGGADEGDAVAAIRRGMELGITTIDTAAVYGFGQSERLVGKAIAGHRDEVRVLTKFGLRWDRDGSMPFDTTDADGKLLKVVRCAKADSVVEECENSLRRLGVDVIDLYQHHWPDPETELEETFTALAKLLEQGKIRCAGVSNYTPEQIEEASRYVPLASCQPPYSMINRGKGEPVLAYCREHDIGVVVYSPMQRGLLTGKFAEDHQFKPGDGRAGSPMFRPANIRRVNAMLESLRPVADAHNATFAQLAIAWAIHRPGVTAALVGARNPRQVTDNAGAADVKLSDDEMRTIEERLSELELDLSR